MPAWHCPTMNGWLIPRPEPQRWSAQPMRSLRPFALFAFPLSCPDRGPLPSHPAASQFQPAGTVSPKRPSAVQSRCPCAQCRIILCQARRPLTERPAAPNYRRPAIKSSRHIQQIDSNIWAGIRFKYPAGIPPPVRVRQQSRLDKFRQSPARPRRHANRNAAGPRATCAAASAQKRRRTSCEDASRSGQA